MSPKITLEDWSTSKPCISVIIFRRDLFGPAAKCSPGLPQQILCNFSKAKKKIVVFQVPCQKKTGSVGRFFFFFFLDRHRSSVMLVP